jgi:hypothetical protein
MVYRKRDEETYGRAPEQKDIGAESVEEMLKNLERTRRDIERFEKLAAKASRVKDPPMSSAERIKAYRERQRELALPPNRCCEVCGAIKLKSRQWVWTGRRAICKSCFMKGAR